MSPSAPKPLTVAVTGPTGTFGSGLIPLLEADERVGRIVGVARRPFDPSSRGWTKMEYRQGDVREIDSLRAPFEGADVVVHLAFLITGTENRDTTHAVNVEGTRSVFRVAAAAGVKRFVYASSLAAYGFFDDNPIGMTEEHPVRPAEHLFYAQQKAQVEEILDAESETYPDVEVYRLRPPFVVGPDTMGAKEVLPGPLAPLGRKLIELAGSIKAPIPVPAPPIECQFIHQDDVGRALQLCIHAAGPPGAYNISGDGIVTGVDVVRALGFTPVQIPVGVVQAVGKAIASAPMTPPALEWAEVLTHPAIMDTTKARRDLGFTPRYSSAEALAAATGRR